jgi:class 3 adenylate cyclase
MCADNVDESTRALLNSAFDSDNKLRISIRIGVHCGDVVAGVVGKKQPVRLCPVSPSPAGRR